jgi:hypothetical protein
MVRDGKREKKIFLERKEKRRQDPKKRLLRKGCDEIFP